MSLLVDLTERIILHNLTKLKNREDCRDDKLCGRRRGSTYNTNVGLALTPVGECYAKPELVDLRRPDRQRAGARSLHRPHRPLHLYGQGPET